MSAAVAAPRSEFLGHPRGLATLFLVEMWERFSYYGMRALLVLFMVDQVERGGLGFSDATANAVYGLYTAASFIVCLPGGWIADRLWGAKRAVWIGGVLIMCGHFTLAVPGITTFFLGLLLVSLGTGLLKPNVSAMVADLYGTDDPRRDAGFTLFYVGINVGAAIGPIVCGWLADRQWHYGFAAAGVGMLAGLIQFRAQQAQLSGIGLAPALPPSRGLHISTWTITAAVLAAALLTLAAGVGGSVAFDAVLLGRGAAAAIAVAAIGYFVFIFTTGRLTRDERMRMYVIVVLVAASALFWAGYEQTGSSLNLFAERYTERTVGQLEIPAEWFQSLNPVFILVFAPLFSLLWVALARRHLEPSTPAKFAIGLIFLGLGFAVMIGAATVVAAGRSAFPSWLVYTYLLHTLGELALSPVGLSAMTKLAPRRFVGQMMGLWFMCTALGDMLAGLLAGAFRTDAIGEWPGLYTDFVIVAVGVGLLLLALAKPLRRLMGETA